MHSGFVAACVMPSYVKIRDAFGTNASLNPCENKHR